MIHELYVMLNKKDHANSEIFWLSMRPDLGFPMEKVTCAKFECSWLKRVLVTDLINLVFELAR